MKQIGLFLFLLLHSTLIGLPGFGNRNPASNIPHPISRHYHPANSGKHLAFRFNLPKTEIVHLEFRRRKNKTPFQ